MTIKKLKKWTLITSVCLFAAAPLYATTLKLSHVRPEGATIDVDVRHFADDVAKATNNKIKIQVYPASALGDYTLVQQRVGLGAVDMAVQPPSSSVDKRFQIVYLPYLVNNWAEAKKVFAPNSPLRNTVSQLYAKQGIKVLAGWPVYFGGISLNKYVANAADPNVKKGIKLRVPPVKAFQLTADDIGYIGSPLPFSEAFTAVQTGVVDGVMGSGAEGYYASFRDVTKYYLPLNTHFEMWYLIINQETFDDLNKQEQNALMTAAAKFESARWESAEADQKRNEQLLVKAGATILPVTDQQIEETSKIVRQKVWPVVIKDMGAKWADGVLDKAIGTH
ncbi:TRAP transporter substrate-binding protein DctP [Marinomonas spartinae]|uniref:TRAP transporter substrate-binding protein DctP n=1 Tax=Marinomonas spartinae TaxID=1792290 RepID=UPI0018F22E48|nr:TRAP transporter substrate-binding protein DctP [Marinomonas spartinae]MBJ7552828.1 TRAP transporter substrate-binding protein DctP [Marinomonas spartinae]